MQKTLVFQRSDALNKYRRTTAHKPGDSAGWPLAREAGRRPDDVRHRLHGRADHRPGVQRLGRHQLRLALDLLHQRAAGAYTGATPLFPMFRSPVGGEKQNGHPERSSLLRTPGGPRSFCLPGPHDKSTGCPARARSALRYGTAGYVSAPTPPAGLRYGLRRRSLSLACRACYRTGTRASRKPRWRLLPPGVSQPRYAARQ